MQAGDLVRIKRASIGIPMDTLGLVTAKVDIREALRRDASDAMMQDSYGNANQRLWQYLNEDHPPDIWEVQMFGVKPHARRYMSRDLEVVNASR